jgi:hypothetical protein
MFIFEKAGHLFFYAYKKGAGHKAQGARYEAQGSWRTAQGVRPLFSTA